jgi:hypothetical protein
MDIGEGYAYIVLRMTHRSHHHASCVPGTSQSGQTFAHGGHRPANFSLGPY